MLNSLDSGPLFRPLPLHGPTLTPYPICTPAPMHLLLPRYAPLLYHSSLLYFRSIDVELSRSRLGSLTLLSGIVKGPHPTRAHNTAGGHRTRHPRPHRDPPPPPPLTRRVNPTSPFLQEHRCRTLSILACSPSPSIAARTNPYP